MTRYASLAFALFFWFVGLAFPGEPASFQRVLPSVAPRIATIFGVGDIMQCASPAGAERTGQLMESLLNSTPNSIGVTFGDNSNDNGSEAEFECFDRSRWGRLMDRLYPTPGNHDYGVDKLLPFYFLYFPHAGVPSRGYHAYDFGGWRIYALNSELISPALRAEHLQWLEQDLSARHGKQCMLAYFHRPPFSSGQFASPAWVMPIFRKLYKYGVDLVATGHEHFFASLPPLTPEGNVDSAYGVPLLIAGTGGAVLFERPARLKYGSHGEVVMAQTLGVLRIDLKPGTFAWTFLPVAGKSRPSGTGQCHENPPGYVG